MHTPHDPLQPHICPESAPTAAQDPSNRRQLALFIASAFFPCSAPQFHSRYLHSSHLFILYLTRTPISCKVAPPRMNPAPSSFSPHSHLARALTPLALHSTSLHPPTVFLSAFCICLPPHCFSTPTIPPCSRFASLLANHRAHLFLLLTPSLTHPYAANRCRSQAAVFFISLHCFTFNGLGHLVVLLFTYFPHPCLGFSPPSIATLCAVLSCPARTQLSRLASLITTPTSLIYRASRPL